MAMAKQRSTKDRDTNLKHPKAKQPQTQMPNTQKAKQPQTQTLKTQKETEFHIDSIFYVMDDGRHLVFILEDPKTIKWYNEEQALKAARKAGHGLLRITKKHPLRGSNH